MDKEWLEWLKVLAPIVTLFVSALLTVAGYFAKKAIDGYGQRISAGETKVQEVEKDLLKFQAQLPRVYVLKDDHIRHMTILEKKIDDNAETTARALASVAGDIKLLLRETPKRKTDG
mgnify:CR=1 FL=1